MANAEAFGTLKGNFNNALLDALTSPSWSIRHWVWRILNPRAVRFLVALEGSDSISLNQLGSIFYVR